MADPTPRTPAEVKKLWEEELARHNSLPPPRATHPLGNQVTDTSPERRKELEHEYERSLKLAREYTTATPPTPRPTNHRLPSTY
jgi:hypothetical protein